MPSQQYKRRDFLKLSGGAAGAAVLARNAHGQATPDQGPTPAPQQHAPIDVVRVGLIGVGQRGSHLLLPLTAIDGVELRAICDIREDRAAAAQQRVEEAGKPRPDVYTRGPQDYERMCARDDLDVVIIATPWDWHVPMATAAMRAGKHAFTEVPAATTIDGCWELVETSEQTRQHCVIMENCCYFRNAMLVLNLVRKGLLGEMLHAEAGYQHYRIAGNIFDEQGNLSWCGQEEAERDGNLYPTHAVGPIGQWLNINRGDRFDYLVSMSSKSRGLNIYAEEHFGPNHPMAKKDYALGDINTTLIRTENGCTITLYHDTQAPRPYNLIYRAQGTKGLYLGTLDQVHIEGRSPDHQWESAEPYYEEYGHPLWKAWGEAAVGQGHGGADYIMLRRLFASLQRGETPDMDVYDAADWSAITDLSVASVANKSRPRDFPDFTRGQWKHRPPLDIAQP